MSSEGSMSVGDRTYVIIGGGSSIGGCVARSLADAGASVQLVVRDAEKVASLAADTGADVLTADATDFGAVERCLKEVAAAGGRVDGVVNCVGSILLKPAHLTTFDDLQEVLSKNLVTAFATVRAAAGVMRKTGGAIVLLSTGAAEIGLANHEAIAAAKAGVVGLMRSAAATYASHGIRVNAVAPGLVDTPMSARITGNETALHASIGMHPLGRIGKPEDVAQAICWLLGPGGEWVTGQVIGVDGGLSKVKSLRPSRG